MEKNTLFVNGEEFRFYNHLFAVSCKGTALRKLQPFIPKDNRKDGYLVLGRMLLLHRAVATCWCIKPEDAVLVHHINGLKQDNRAENLEWITSKQHIAERHSELNFGKYIRSESTRQKIRDFRTGFKDTEEVRIVKTAILIKVCPKSTCRYKDTIFPSVSAAARFLNIPTPTFRQRCMSKNFSDYELLKSFYNK